MQISSRFTIATHIMLCIYFFSEKEKVTSEFLSKSTNINPVIIRNILGQLKKSGLVKIARGTGGAKIAQPIDRITLLDLYKAAQSVDKDNLFNFHENPNNMCPVGRNIHKVLDDKLIDAQQALENQLKKTTLKELIDKLNQNI